MMPQEGDGENSATGTVSDMTDSDLLIKYCLDNKINKTAIDELLKRGFDSLEALKLVNMEDLSSQNIPMGQRRLIFHIAQALHAPTTTSGSNSQSGTNSATTTSQGNTGVSHGNPLAGATYANQSAPAFTATPLAGNTGVSQNSLGQPVPNQDIYSQTLLNTLLSQQTQLAALGQSADNVNNVTDNGTLILDNNNAARSGTLIQSSQPSWNDPLIHIASATGKSTSTFYDVCDFVPHSVDEDLVVGGQGDQQLVIKSGPKKPKLESLTLSQWSIANLAILYKLVNDGKLVGPSLMDYLSYTTKVYQLVQRFSLVSVLLYDREYRKLQGSMGFRWGTDVQHLHTLFLQPRPSGGSQGGHCHWHEENQHKLPKAQG